MAEKAKPLEATPRKQAEASAPLRTPPSLSSSFGFASVVAAAGNMSIQRAAREHGFGRSGHDPSFPFATPKSGTSSSSDKLQPGPGSGFAKTVSATQPLGVQLACASGCSCDKCDIQLATASGERSGKHPAKEVLTRLGQGVPLDPLLAMTLSPGFGLDLTDVRVHIDTPVASTIGARAFTVGNHIAFAPGEFNPLTEAGRNLIGHELAHVAQQSNGVGAADQIADPEPTSVDIWEQEAEAAGSAVATGRRPGILTPFRMTAVQRRPDPPDTAEIPFSASISEEFKNPKVPEKLDVKVTLRTPGFGADKSEKQTLVLHKPVLGATSATAYQVRLSDLYPSAEAAAEARKRARKDREELSLRGDPQAALEKAAAKIEAAKSTGAKTAASAEAADVSTSPGKVVHAGPVPADVVELAYALSGEPVALVARSADFGITTEYHKLAVGAASTTILKTPTGFSLIDVGVRHDGPTKDPKAMEYCLRLTRKIIGSNPIEEIFITHAHLDHVGMLDAISREFVIKEITINAIQLIDPRFLEAAQNLGQNQRALMEETLRLKYEGQRSAWDADPTLNRLIPEPGAREAHFKEWVRNRVSVDIATMKPIQVNVITPGVSTVDARSVRIGGIEIVPKQAAAPSAPGEGFSFTEYARTTLADPRLQEKYEALKKAQEIDPNAKMVGFVDEMASSRVMRLPNGNQLIVVPDIRADDIARIQRTLKTQLGRLGADVEFRLWDMTHHVQSGYVAAKEKATTTGATGALPDPQVGAIRMSQLERLSEMLSQLTRTPGKRGGATVDVVTVSVDPSKVDPSLKEFLRACGLHVLTAEGERELQFLEGKTALGRDVAGFVEGPGGTRMPTDPLLRRTTIALEQLREELNGAKENLAKEQAEKGAEADAKEAAQKTQRQELMSQKKALRSVRERASKAVTDPSPRQKAQSSEDARNKALTEAQSNFDAKVAEVEALDKQVEVIRQEGERLAPEVERLQKQISGIEQARRSYLTKMETFSLSPQDPRPRVPDPFEEPGRRVLEAEEIALEKVVRPVYNEALTAGKLPVLGETSLIIFGKDATTEAGRKLEVDRAAMEVLRDRIATGDRPIQAHAELIARIQEHVTELKARPDASDPTVVDQIAHLEEQAERSQTTVKEAAAKGRQYLDRDPTTGARTRSYVLTETSTEAAQKEGPQGEGATQKGMRLFGRAMGGVMVYHEITGALDLANRYEAGKANRAELTIGLSRSTYGVNIGYRMLKGAHVGMGEFVILSVLDVAQVALADYDSSEAYNTEVTFAIIRNAVNLACAAIGMALIGTANPVGILAGLAIMFLGDIILDALGLHDWLAKKFDFRPDEYIELEKNLLELLNDYTVIVGALEFQGRTDVSLKALGAQSPEVVRSVAGEVVLQRRAELQSKEFEIMKEFEAAYARGKQGYSHLREVDDLRAQFLDLYLRAHKDDASVKGVSTWGANISSQGKVIPRFLSALTIAEVQQRFASMELLLTQEDITLDRISKMEQWSNMDKWIGKLEDHLYRTDPASIDWMKVSEAERNVMLMVNNAHYRLDPQLQSKHRMTPLFPEGTPERKEYERLLLERENRLDHLRQRTVDVAIGKAAPEVAAEGGTECEAVDNAPAVACYDVPTTYYDPVYGDLTKVAPLATQLKVAGETVVAYLIQIGRMPKLPGVLTPESLHSDPDTIRGYHDTVIGESGYRSALFALKASSIATGAIVDRLKAAARAQTLSEQDEKNVLDVAEKYRLAEEDRRVEHGYLFLEEVPAIEEKVQTARSRRLGAVFGDQLLEQMTKEEHAAAATDRLKIYELGSLTDRLMTLDVRLPEDPNLPIPGVFELSFAPGVVVAGKRKAGEETPMIQEPGGGMVLKVVPVNAAGIAYYGNTYDQWVSLWMLTPVTINQLQAINEENAAEATP